MIRRLWIAGVAVVVLGGSIAIAAMARGSGSDEPKTKLPPATAKVTKTTLVETKTVAGTLGYGDPVPVDATATGTLTWIASVDSTVDRGQPLFKVDERPVVALYGSLPLYRPLQVGTVGADVRQLEQNLTALGYAGLADVDTYTSDTAAVVQAWQGDLGLPQSGVVEPDQVVVTPGPIRIAEDAARVGDQASGGGREGSASVLSYTGTSKLVTIELALADRALATQGRTVTVTVPGAGIVEGTISAVSAVATTQEQAGGTGGGPRSATEEARVQVTVTIADQAALGSLDAAPVDVDLVSDERKDVLAVPVTALLALPDGGFGVEVVDGGTTHLLAVRTGLFAAGRVEISGSGIAEGVTVGAAT
jgi:peptidoglycan hydrolase-like protein with peptidoglycan-binding domain